MSPRSDAVLTPNLSVGNPNLLPAASILPEEPAVDLIESVYPEKLPFPAPAESTRHVRVIYTEGPDRFVSFTPDLYTEQDDYRTHRCVDLGRVYVDGIEQNIWRANEQLAQKLE